MKKSILISSSLLLFFCIPFIASSQYSDFETIGQASIGNCTSIMVGRLASTDGSVMTSHTCDGIYRTWLEVFPHSKYGSGTMHPVYWDMCLPRADRDFSKITKKGEIPEVAETFAFMNTAYPCLNEKQLAIGETTLFGRSELINQDGMFQIEELEKIALQRCTTAREAISLIGKLAEEYGYGGYMPECITIADPKEVWQLEISGSGKGKPSAIWCAARIPDDHVGVSANIPRISTIDFNNPDLFMYSTDLQNVAKRLGLWDGNEPMKFYRIIGGSKGKPFDMRELYILSSLAPSLNLSFRNEELPFSVKPEKKLSPRDLMKFFRETYEGTQWELTKDLMITVKKKDDNGNVIEEKIKSPAVNNWMSWEMIKLLNELKPGVAVNHGPIAQAMCSYSHVIQCRSWLPDEVGAIAWFSFDNPGESPRIPIFSGVLYLPESFSNCGQYKYRTDAAIWSFREANRLATINWSVGRTLIEPAVKELEDKAFEEVPVIEMNAVEMIKAGKLKKAKEYITSYTNEFALNAMKKWEEIKVSLWSLIGTDFYPLK